jgi:hypothetical protein
VHISFLFESSTSVEVSTMKYLTLGYLRAHEGRPEDALLCSTGIDHFTHLFGKRMVVCERNIEKWLDNEREGASYIPEDELAHTLYCLSSYELKQEFQEYCGFRMSLMGTLPRPRLVKAAVQILERILS